MFLLGAQLIETRVQQLTLSRPASWARGRIEHAGIPMRAQTDMCTHCDRTCVKECFPSIYPLAQADLAQLVEHNLAKVGVAGSSPVVRSSESSSAVSPGEAALFRYGPPSAYTKRPGRPSSQGKLATRATRTLCQSHRRLGKPLVLRCYFVTMTEISSLMVL